MGKTTVPYFIPKSSARGAALAGLLQGLIGVRKEDATKAERTIERKEDAELKKALIRLRTEGELEVTEKVQSAITGRQTQKELFESPFKTRGLDIQEGGLTLGREELDKRFTLKEKEFKREGERDIVADTQFGQEFGLREELGRGQLAQGKQRVEQEADRIKETQRHNEATESFSAAQLAFSKEASNKQLEARYFETLGDLLGTRYGFQVKLLVEQSRAFSEALSNSEGAQRNKFLMEYARMYNNTLIAVANAKDPKAAKLLTDTLPHLSKINTLIGKEFDIPWEGVEVDWIEKTWRDKLRPELFGGDKSGPAISAPSPQTKVNDAIQFVISSGVKGPFDDNDAKALSDRYDLELDTAKEILKNIESGVKEANIESQGTGSADTLNNLNKILQLPTPELDSLIEQAKTKAGVK